MLVVLRVERRENTLDRSIYSRLIINESVTEASYFTVVMIVLFCTNSLENTEHFTDDFITHPDFIQYSFI